MQEKQLVCVSSLDCLIGWRLFYLSFAQVGRGGEKGGDLRVAVNLVVWSSPLRRMQGRLGCLETGGGDEGCKRHWG